MVKTKRALGRNKTAKKRPLPTIATPISRESAATRAIRLGYQDEATSGLVYSETRTEADLRACQRVGRRFFRRHEYGALLADMGTGKTTIGLFGIVDALIDGRLDKPALIVAPTRVVQEVWRQEARVWEYTRDLRFSAVLGTAAQRAKKLNRPAHIYMINFENLRWLVLLFRKAKEWPFGLLLIDESSFLKAPNTKRFRALASVINRFPLRFIASATPRPQGALGLWSQYYLLDLGARLGVDYARYQNRYFTSDYMGYKYTLRPGANAKISRNVDDISLRLDRRDWLGDLPPIISNIVRVPLPQNVRRQYETLEKEMFIELDKGDVTAISAGVLVNKTHQFANGACWLTTEDGSRNWTHIHDAKLDALEEIYDESSTPIIVAYQFRHDLERLRKRFKTGVVFDKARLREIKRAWDARRIPMLFMHPRNGGHGLNMQHGGNTLVFFSLTHSLEQHDQIIGRIGPARQLGLADNVIVHYIVAKGTVDEAILMSNKANSRDQDTFMDALNKYRRKVSGR